MAQDWADKLSYLQESRFQYHNGDYLEFLVRKVWRIRESCRVVDFGCGYGYFGTAILPQMPEGSSYTGIDVSEKLIDEGEELFGKLPYNGRFVPGDVCNTPFADGEFDVATCHSLLMHLKNPEEAVREMARVTRPGGWVIACESNVNAVNALLHVAEIEQSTAVDLGFLQENFDRIQNLTGSDFNIGAKVPVLFQEAGLENVGARTSDSVKCSLPPVSSEADHKRLTSMLRDLGETIDDKKAEEMKKAFLKRGFSEEESLGQVDRAKLFVNRIRKNPEAFHIVFPHAMTFSFGRVPR